MTQNFDNILLFKTNINCQDDTSFLRVVLDNNPQIDEWSVDLEDVDKVLRIISYTLTHQQIIMLLNEQGYSCLEFS